MLSQFVDVHHNVFVAMGIGCFHLYLIGGWGSTLNSDSRSKYAGGGINLSPLPVTANDFAAGKPGRFIAWSLCRVLRGANQRRANAEGQQHHKDELGGAISYLNRHQILLSNTARPEYELFALD